MWDLMHFYVVKTSNMTGNFSAVVKLIVKIWDEMMREQCSEMNALNTLSVQFSVDNFYLNFAPEFPRTVGVAELFLFEC